MIPRLTIVAPAYTGPFSASLLRELRTLAGMSSQFFAVGDDPQIQSRRLRALVANQQSPQAIALISIRPDADTVRLYSERSIPMVLIDETAPGVASVACDNFLGGYVAGRHLISKGHRRVALVTGRVTGPGSWNAAQRRDGLRKALSELHLVPVVQHETPDYSAENGLSALRNALTAESTAVFCASGDVVAGGMLKTCPDVGVDVPKGLAVVGFDDLGTADLLGLTTIRQPIHNLSEVAYRMTCITPRDTMERPEQILLPPTLIERRTV